MVRERKERKKVVAGVCYRRRNGDVEFLLVRTKGGAKWTFPKGHVAESEEREPWRAAAREAREEAGVLGVVETTPFARYAYPDTRSKRESGDSVVAAYLLDVTSRERPRADEEFRDPSWFAPGEAIEKLAEGGREQRYVDEHARVVSAALERIESRSG